MLKKIILAASLLSMASCATIFSPNNDSISFDSNPQGAKVFMNGGNVGVTPVTVSVPRSLSVPQIALKKDGYETTNVNLQNSFNNTSLLNILFPLGFAVDAATGQIMHYNTLNYETTLEKK